MMRSLPLLVLVGVLLGVSASWGERPLALLGNAQDLVALEFSKAFNDGLSQCPHCCPLPLQCLASLHGVILLSPHGAAPSWGTTADTAIWSTTAPIRGHPVLAAETTPTVATFRTAMAEKVLLELVVAYRATTDTTLGHLASPLLPCAPLDPAWGHGLGTLLLLMNLLGIVPGWADAPP
jgi:hypothetical protein